MHLVELKNISKTFPGVRALKDVSFTLNPGEVHALCGENGAGKSTLMNILVGNLQPDEGGEIVLEGVSLSGYDFNQAHSLGISIVYQERSLSDNLSIAENIYANCQPKNRWGFLDYAQLYQETQDILNWVGLSDLKPQMLVENLSAAQKQLVEIGKALAQSPSILIMDEPTASITERETQHLFRLIRDLKGIGMGIIYISHRLAEIFAIADRITVLKDGAYQATLPAKKADSAKLIKLMVGRDLGELAKNQKSPGSEVALEVKGLSGAKFKDIHFKLQQGEILALAGLVGAGRSEIARAIFGMDRYDHGEVWVKGQQRHFSHPAEAVAAGLAYVPEERKSQGIFPDHSVAENILAAQFAGSSWGGGEGEAHRQKLAQEQFDDLRIVAPSLRQVVRLLSGGNQQKTVLGRWLSKNPQVLIVDEPTHGVDVGAKFEIYQLLQKLAAQGTAILLISSELPEVLALADRVVVLCEGQISGELSAAEASEEGILRLAAGMN
jgi:ribose transport system ATP-binding protein